MEIEIKVLLKVEEEVTIWRHPFIYLFFFFIYVSVDSHYLCLDIILGRLHSLAQYRERRGRIFNSEGDHVSSSSGGNMTTPNIRPSNMVMASK